MHDKNKHSNTKQTYVHRVNNNIYQYLSTLKIYKSDINCSGGIFYNLFVNAGTREYFESGAPPLFLTKIVDTVKRKKKINKEQKKKRKAVTTLSTSMKHTCNKGILKVVNAANTIKLRMSTNLINSILPLL